MGVEMDERNRIFNAEMTSDETIEILDHLWHLRSKH